MVRLQYSATPIDDPLFVLCFVVCVVSYFPHLMKTMLSKVLFALIHVFICQVCDLNGVSLFRVAFHTG